MGFGVEGEADGVEGEVVGAQGLGVVALADLGEGAAGMAAVRMGNAKRLVALPGCPLGGAAATSRPTGPPSPSYRQRLSIAAVDKSPLDRGQNASAPG